MAVTISFFDGNGFVTACSGIMTKNCLGLRCICVAYTSIFIGENYDKEMDGKI